MPCASKSLSSLTDLPSASIPNSFGFRNLTPPVCGASSSSCLICLNISVLPIRPESFCEVTFAVSLVLARALFQSVCKYPAASPKALLTCGKLSSCLPLRIPFSLCNPSINMSLVSKSKPFLFFGPGFNSSKNSLCAVCLSTPKLSCISFTALS